MHIKAGLENSLYKRGSRREKGKGKIGEKKGKMLNLESKGGGGEHDYMKV